MSRIPVFANAFTFAEALPGESQAPAAGDRVLFAQNDGKPTVRVERRRRPTSGGSRGARRCAAA